MTRETGSPDVKPPPVDRLSHLWRRVNEHKIVQWSVAYIAVAYALQHGVVLTGEAFEWPEAVLRVTMLLMIVGLPVVVTLAWYHGERASRHFSAAELTIISILLVIGSVVFYTAVQPHEEFAAGPASAKQQTGVEKARAAAASTAGAISVAVLPFANMSGDPSQEFFSDGMTEEITTALAKIPDLRVVARTSAFQFKDQNRDVQAIAQTLHATHVIEGSVRKAGTRLRITAQLVNADNGVSIWTNSYDRDLTDVFAIQEDIARAIAGSLRMPLGLKLGENLVNNRAISSDDYQQYLRAQALILARGRAGTAEAMALLEQIVARNANYAPAWANLGGSYYFMINTDPTRNSGSVDEFRRVVDAYMPKVETASRRALQLDPNYPGGYAGLSIIEFDRGNFLSADELAAKAFALDPNEPRALHGRSIRLAISGNIKQANTVRQQLQAVEPFVPVYNRFTALYLWVEGQNDAALAILKEMPPDAPNRTTDLARIYASMGRFGEAADFLENAPPGNGSRDTLKEAARLLRSAPSNAPARPGIPRFGVNLDWVFLYVGAPERALESYEHNLQSGFPGAAALALIWHASYAPVRKTERYKAYVRRLGLVDYWRAKGWPDLCRPIGTDDFECN